jgi:hypothetical protein
MISETSSTRVVSLFRKAILGACNYPCPAVQDAIDTLAAESCESPTRRAGLLTWLDTTATDAWLCDRVAVQWGRNSRALKLATGLDRDAWWAIFSAGR